MKKVKVRLLILLFFFVTMANAQYRPVIVGVKGGVNVSNYGGGIKDTDGKIGFVGGVTVDYNVDELIFIRSGIDIATKGAKYKTESIEYTYSPVYLQIPVHAGYKMPFTNTLCCSLHVGPYFAYGVGGKFKSSGAIGEADNKEIDFFGSKAEGGFKKIDFGLGLGIGVEFGKIGFDFAYDLGLANISNDKEMKMKNMNAYLALTYKF